MTILENIIAHKRHELDLIRKKYPIKKLERSIFFSRNPLSLSGALSDPGKKGIIAEFKRRSPSKGIINLKADVKEVSTGYAMAGASALSILTDLKFFGGSIDDLKIARKLNNIPILRKDFIIDEYQVVESKAIGADAILLIAAALEKGKIYDLAAVADTLGLEVILELHSTEEIEKVNDKINVIGVNNRDLKTFTVDLNISIGMADRIPSQFIKISESGLSSPESIVSLLKAGYNGFLIGELFMSREDPVSALNNFIRQIPVNYAES
jgi:indole-3-glycerol phosphate synthase